MRSKINKLTISLAILALTVGCVKKREQLEDQGSNQKDLIPIELIGNNPNNLILLQGDSGAGCDDKSIFIKTSYTIETGDQLRKVENSAAKDIFVEKGVPYFKYQNEVSYTSSDPLLKKGRKTSRMLGQPGKKYGVLHQITPSHFIINKVVKNSEVSHLEKTYSCKNGDDWIVPVGGYSIDGFYNKEFRRDSDNRNTNVLIKVEVPPQDFKMAKFYSINKSDFIPFKRESKIDLFPKTFFEKDEWYFSTTVVATRYGSKTYAGGLGATDASLNPTSKVKFIIQDDFIFAVNTNIDDDLKAAKHNLNYNVALKIPVKNMDYHREAEGTSFIGLEESEDESKSEDQKRFITLSLKDAETPSFTSSVSSLLERIFQRSNRFKEVVSLRIGDGYLSFMVEDGESGTLTRYSFKKVDQGAVANIPVRRLFQSDFEKFGAFSTQKAQKFDFKIARKEDLDKNKLMARHNPNEDIVYHFSTLTPKDDWYRDVGRETINLWQQAFKKAGLKINIVLDENKDVELGDIRYNIMNIPSANQVGLLGFGPSLTDSDTGEMISSTMNTYMGTVLLSQYRVVRNYIARKSGVAYDFKNSSNTKINSIFGNTNFENGNKAAAGSILRLFDSINIDNFVSDESGLLLPAYGRELLDQNGNIDFSPMTDEQKKFFQVIGVRHGMSIAEIQALVYDYQEKFGLHLLSSSSIETDINSASTSSTNITDAYIEKHCPQVNKFVDMMVQLKLKNESDDTNSQPKVTTISTEEEIQKIDRCVRLLTQADSLETTVHELGHNLSLRHNFIGSFDQDNYVSPDDYTLRFMDPLLTDLFGGVSSSVMEYTAGQAKNIFPGKYDIAAIRWIYSGKVELDNGTVISTDTSKPISDSVAGGSLRDYKFCTDQHAYRLRNSPYCMTRDYGVTQTEIIQHEIDSLYKSYSNLYRYDGVFPRVNASVSFGKLKAHYDQWRADVSKFAGDKNVYLEGYSPERYKKDIIEKMLNHADETKRKEYKEALAVRNLIVKFLVDISMMNNKYCIVTDKYSQDKDDTIALELAIIRNQLLKERSTAFVSSCSNPVVKSYLKNHQNKYELVDEVGHFIDPGRFSLNPFAEDWLDFGGTGGLRIEAFAALTVRRAPSIINRRTGFAPNMLDEPDIRLFVEKILKDRILSGVRLNKEKFDIDAATTTELFEPETFDYYFKRKAYKNFEEEKQMLTLYARFFRMGMGVPGNPNESFIRRDNINVRFIDVIDKVKEEAVDSLFVGNGHFWIRKKGTLISEMFDKTRQNSFNKGMAGFTQEQFDATKNNILKGFEAVLPKEGELITVGHLLNISSNAARLSQDPKLQNNIPFLVLLRDLFKVESKLMADYSKSLAKSGIKLQDLFGVLNDEKATTEQKESAQAQLDIIISSEASSLYAALQKDADPGVKIVEPTTAGIELRYQEFLTSFLQKKMNTQRHADEVDAQNQFILSLLSIFSGQR